MKRVVPPRFFLLLSLFALVSVPVYADARTDVLVVVNDNSRDSAPLATYYAQRRNIAAENIVHVRVPNQYFINWTEFQSLRDQILRAGICPRVPLRSRPVACSNPGEPIYTADTIAALTANTGIRYVVLTRGVPTRVTVDGSTLAFPNESTSVDNYLSYWLARYLTSDVVLNFNEREAAFNAPHAQRVVSPQRDREYIVGRIDGVDLPAAKALIDRALAAERDGIYGHLYGAANGPSVWKNYGNNLPFYGDHATAWRYPLGVFDEARPECAAYTDADHYLNFPANNVRGKSPAYCNAVFSKYSPNEPAPGLSYGRHPLATDALVYLGMLDGQTVGGFNTLLNWRKNSQCSALLCEQAADVNACRAASSDPQREINTDCVGVAPGFIGYNYQSYPVAYLGIWPTGWQPIGIGGGLNDVVRVDNTVGADDSVSAWFDRPDETADPSCFVYTGGILQTVTQPCRARRYVGLSQRIAAQAADANNPPAYRFSFQAKSEAIAAASAFSSSALFWYTKAANVACPSPLQGAVSGTSCTYNSYATHAVAVGDGAWTLYSRDVVPPAIAGFNYNAIELRFSANLVGGRLGFDAVSWVDLSAARELVVNGSFNQGHKQAASGDYAANFLNRLGGTAFWGSLSHHESGGHSFSATSTGTLVYWLRGLPLGDAVWLGETRNSGILYGDPLYSPAAVFLHVNRDDTRVFDNAALRGVARNGKDTAAVQTRYRIDYCAGKDFFVCDRAQSWQPTGIAGEGPRAGAFGSFATAGLPYGDYTFRLSAASAHRTRGVEQTFNDYVPIKNRYGSDEVPTYAIAGNILDTAGRPVPGVNVAINDNFGFTSNNVTDVLGAYRLTGLKPGTYLVYPTQTGRSFTPTAGTVFVTLTNVGAIKNFTANTTGNVLSGVVRNTGGTPLAGIAVNIGGAGAAITNTAGYYAIGGLAAGSYVVTATHGGYTFASVPVTVAGATAQDLTAQGTNYRIGGRVKDAAGAPLAGVSVNLYGARAGTSVSNASGDYEFAGLANGFHIVMPSRDGYAFQADTGNAFVEVRGADVTDKHYTGAKNAVTYSIAGFVRNRSGGVANAAITARASDGQVLSAVTDTAGYYRIAGCAPGAYTLSAQATGLRVTPASLAIDIIDAGVIDRNFNAR